MSEISILRQFMIGGSGLMSENKFLRKLEILAVIARRSLRGHKRNNHRVVESTRRGSARSRSFSTTVLQSTLMRLRSHPNDADGMAMVNASCRVPS
jgi:hypothetical protein